VPAFIVASLINQNGILRYARFKRTPFLQENSPLGKDFLRGTSARRNPSEVFDGGFEFASG